MRQKKIHKFFQITNFILYILIVYNGCLLCINLITKQGLQQQNSEHSAGVSAAPTVGKFENVVSPGCGSRDQPLCKTEPV